MNLRTTFRFTLPNGYGVKAEAGRKVSGTMRLIQVKDLLEIEQDKLVMQESGAFLVVLLSKVVSDFGLIRMVNRNTIEQLAPEDFAFLVDFMHEINHQVLKRLPLSCPSCGHTYTGSFAQLGEV